MDNRTFGPDPFLNGSFNGSIQIKTWQRLFIARKGPYIEDVDYDSSPYTWQILPSARAGSYWIRTNVGGKLYYWRAEPDNKHHKITLHDGCGDWETFSILRHPSGGYALKNFANQRYLTAEPNDHSIHLVCDREPVELWQCFTIDIVRNGTAVPAS